MWKTFLLAAWMVGCSGNTSDETEAESDDEALAKCAERNEMIVWSPNTPMDSILEPLTANAKCTHWYVGVPLIAGDKTNFHADIKSKLDAIHERGSNFHVLAEFHWSSWRQWTIDNNKTWYEAGVEFRRRMDVAGFVIHYGDSDTWALQELPSTLVHSDDPNTTVQEVRANAMNAIRGLYEGPKLDKGRKEKKGVVYRTGVANDYTNQAAMNASKKRVQAWLSDDAFWASMNRHVRWWAEETYADPLNECVPGSLTGIRARHINDYVFHIPELAEHGPATARNFFRKTFTPLLNAAWKAPLGYGRNDVSADDFIHHVSTEVYAVRAWQGQHQAYGNRLGFAWVPHPANDTEKARVRDIGKRIGNSVDDVFKAGHGAAYACSPSGAYTLCQCQINGAQFVETWATTWDSW